MKEVDDDPLPPTGPLADDALPLLSPRRLRCRRTQTQLASHHHVGIIIIIIIIIITIIIVIIIIFIIIIIMLAAG